MNTHERTTPIERKDIDLLAIHIAGLHEDLKKLQLKIERQDYIIHKLANLVI